MNDNVIPLAHTYVRYKNVNIGIFSVRLHIAINSRASERNGCKKSWTRKRHDKLVQYSQKKRRISHWNQLVAPEWQSVSLSFARNNVPLALYVPRLRDIRIRVRFCTQMFVFDKRAAMENNSAWTRSSRSERSEEWANIDALQFRSRHSVGNANCNARQRTGAPPVMPVLRSDLFMNAPWPRSYIFILRRYRRSRSRSRTLVRL